jgi:thiamine monophosphate synthase
MAKKDKKLWIDMCAGSELKDTQGETLSVEGANIDELERGEGRFNDNHGKGFFNSLGRVTEAKKIFKSEDCENDRHKYYWEKIKAPFVYAKGYLYNDDDHPNARAAAAILRNIHREDTPLKMKASVEGGVLARGIKDPTRLARTKIHSVALTFTPANNATLVEPLNLDKSDLNWEADQQLMKSVMHLAETNVPSFRHIERHASAHTIYENISKIQELAKSVGIELMIKEDIDPDTIMEKAVLNKISTNVSKITHLVKAAKDYANLMKPTAVDTATATPSTPSVPKATTTTATSPGKVQMAAQDKAAAQAAARDQYQQGIGKLKSDPTTPAKPKDLTSTPDNTMRVKSAKQAQVDNHFKTQASKAMKDPSHLGNIQQQLLDQGVPAKKVRAVLTRIRAHMQEQPVKKSIEESMEKDQDVKRAAKNLLLAGAMGLGVHHMGQDSDAKKDAVKKLKNNKKIERTVASSKPKSKRFGDDEYMNQLDDNARARADKTRNKIREKMKKALLAGFGGAGSPTDLTGGGVIQAESLEDGKKKTKKSDGEFDYISCDNCGHEQVYMGNQVKCRKCRQNFSLEKLEDLM